MRTRYGLHEFLIRLDPVLVTGIAVSVCLALVLVLLGQDKVDSLVAGLLSTVITLLIDIVARQRESERRILQAVSLGDVLATDSELHSCLNTIAHDYIAIRKNPFPLFLERSKDALLECKDVLSGLVDGNLTVPPASKYTFGRKGVASAHTSVKAVAYEDIPSWRTEHLRNVVEVNADAIKRGVQVQRVFILSKDSLNTANDVLDAHRQAGVKVFVVTPDELPSTQLLESFMIVDDRVLVYFYYTRDGKQFTGEKISVEPLEVDAAVNCFDTILRRAKLYDGVAR